MSTKEVGLYARVSSEQQAQAQTISSQLDALHERIKKDGGILSPAHEFVDNGYSGSLLTRPGLERLRDAVAFGELDRIYVYSPDRLARKYAYQVMLVDEFERAGVKLVFINRKIGESPEDELLLQMQGMIAEYERAQMLERSRRGKRHKAQKGSVNVLSGAPFGYEYIKAIDGGGEARYEVNEEKAEIVRNIFNWVGRERLSIGDVKRRLESKEIPSPTGKSWWDRTTIWGILKNPAYKGKAAFGKTRAGELRPRLREQKGGSMQPRSGRSTYDVLSEEWLSIPVPSLVSDELFSSVESQLEENRKRSRQGKRGAKYLLQGLLVCDCCGHSYYGKLLSPSARKNKPRSYAYYRCIGSDAYRFGGERLCYNKQVRTDRLEQVVWQEVGHLLEDPKRLESEYQNRLKKIQEGDRNTNLEVLEKQLSKIRKGISRLIDSYADGYLEKEEFEPRIQRFRSRLKTLESQVQEIQEQNQQRGDLERVIGQLEEFSSKVREGLDKLDWHGQRELIRTLVKRVEIGKERVNVVFRIAEGPLPGGEDPFLQDCWKGNFTIVGKCSTPRN